MKHDRLDGLSFDTVHARIEELKRMFPEAVSEGRLDYDLFMALLGDEFDNTHEKYQFTWKGKLDSLKLAQKRSSGTLRPDFEESRDWDATGNLYIEGDNLEVLKLLQQGYLRKVKMIYIDPPYNTGNDFVYEDDFADPIARYKEATGQGMRANPETAGRYHSNWLSMMYPRLKLAKTLLRDDGVIFISIDDNEVHNLRKICDEVFGEENFAAEIIWEKVYSPRMDSIGFSNSHDYVLCYVKKDLSNIKKEVFAQNKSQFNVLDEATGKYYRRRSIRKEGSHSTRSERPNTFYPLTAPDGTELYPIKPDGTEGCWRWSLDTFYANTNMGTVEWVKGETGWQVYAKQFWDEEAVRPFVTLWKHDEVNHTHGAAEALKEIIGARIFDAPKPIELVKKMMLVSTDTDSVILDFFSGSATTAHAVMQLNAEDGGNRKYICVQIPEPTDPASEAYKAGYRTIADIGKERIRRAGDKIRQEAGMLTGTLDTGFRVFKLDTSNLQKWDDSYVKPEEIDLLYQRLDERQHRMKPDRRDIDLVYEVFLKYGIPLTEKLATLPVQGKTFYVVGQDALLFICLDEGLTVEVIEEAAQYAPGTILFADNCFVDDNEIINSGLVMEKAKIEFRWV